MNSVRRKLRIRLVLVAVSGTIALFAVAASRAQAPQSKLVYAGRDGKLQYQADENGNRIPEFSTCGYHGGGVRIPDVPVKISLAPLRLPQDDTARVQQAIDQVQEMPRDENGFRGAVLLKAGKYSISGQLKIFASGVVLRGEGDGDNGTVLVAAGKTRRDLIDIKGPGELKEIVETRQAISDEYVPVGATSFTIANASQFHVGDSVIVRRQGNADWIHFIGMDRITPRPTDPSGTKQWQPFELRFDRVITAIEPSTSSGQAENRITLDAPITCAIEGKWGGGTIAKYEDPGRIELVGVENLRADSEFDANVTEELDGKSYAADENHAEYLVSFDNVKNAWARNLTCTHFYHGIAAARIGAKWVTVEDCKSLDPVCVITGGRRYPYLIVGQQVLMQRLFSRGARHAFVFQARVCGPNVFLDCKSENDFATSEPHHRWSVGGLYDNVDAHMAVQDRQWMGSGHGWAGANYVLWNCEGTLICQKPPTAQNWAIGFVGEKQPGAFPGRPDGYWESLGAHVQPRSLYLKQLKDRLGAAAVNNVATEVQSAARTEG